MYTLKRNIVVLGSTGSIGRQTLAVAEALGLSVRAITGNRNVALLEQQARRFSPALVAAADEETAAELRCRLRDTNICVAGGMEGLLEAASLDRVDTVVTAVVGMVGLRPTLAAIEAGRRIALANKETLVCAGDVVMAKARQHGAEIIPVDSEHSAIFQSLLGQGKRREVKRILLTASGGPFFGKNRETLTHVTKAQALRHPNWSMGPKITVDSATLMNKGLELIEAMHLFQVSPEHVTIVIHRESLVHSMVEYVDGSVIAQLGPPDMRLPIQYALTYPARMPSLGHPLDFTEGCSMTFGKPDDQTFGCLRLACEAAKRKGTACAVLNAANEVAVDLFLQEKCGFLDIERIVEKTMEETPDAQADTLDAILEADGKARKQAALAAARLA